MITICCDAQFSIVVGVAEVPIRLYDGFIMIDVWVVPGAARSEIRGLHGDLIRIRVAAPAHGGEANQALERFLTGRLGCKTRIAKGTSSRRKRVRIESADLSAIVAKLGIAHL